MLPYPGLIEEVDRMSGRLRRRYRAHLVCRCGCAACCRHNLSVFEVEAAALTDAFIAMPSEMRNRIELQAREVKEREALGATVSCPFLVDNRCAVYASRPLICRTQGLPLLYTAEDGSQEVDFCPLNFTAPGAVEELEPGYLVPLDEMNMKVARANLDFCSSTGRKAKESGIRITMSDLILQSSK